MTRHTARATTAVLVALAAAAPAHAADGAGSTLLSGYGAPGGDEQVVLGDARLPGEDHRSGAPAPAAGTRAGTSPGVGGDAGAPQDAATRPAPAPARGDAAERRARRGEDDGDRAAGVTVPGDTAAPPAAPLASVDAAPLLTGSDLGALGAVLGVLALLGLALRRLGGAR
jgi:hypothetical protein